MSKHTKKQKQEPTPKPKQKQITRDNHYVPQWYQRGFLVNGRHKLYVRNLKPGLRDLPDAPALLEPEIEELGPKLAFSGYDLYTTRFGETLNDDIETYLFGRIDKEGAEAVRGWIAGDPVQIHRRFQAFFEYMDVQKLRTPKGLDWILKHYKGLPQVALMTQMQALRQMHCTMWAEGVREIVSASKSTVKFLVSDHPVTIFHPNLGPYTSDCEYPDDPGIELVGSQTIFALDANHCLILTNLEYAEDPAHAALLSRRTNARFRGESMARTDTLIRSRHLAENEVYAINLVIKTRAKQFVAASDPAWLYPEKHCALSWEDIGKVLMPRNELWRFSGEAYFQFSDGTTGYRDKFGRTSSAHELLKKSRREADPAPDDYCGSGSGLVFLECCASVAPQKRPSWNVLSIRERNLALVRAINDILGIKEGAVWDDVRRNLSDEQVGRIHEAFAALWPHDTQLIELLPRPQRKRSRAVFLGMMDVRLLSLQVTGMLAYFDEIVVPHPFVNANGVRPEFSPVLHPEMYREQTLREVYMLLILEPWIRSGQVHLVPDPLDYDHGFQQEIMAITKGATEKLGLGPLDEARSRALMKDEYLRAVSRMPLDSVKSYVTAQSAKAGQVLEDSECDAMASYLKTWQKNDPLSLLDAPLPAGEGGELRMFKSFAREAGLYLATLTGSIVYTDSDTLWTRLHESDGVQQYDQDARAGQLNRLLGTAHLHVPTDTYEFQVEPVNASAIRTFLRGTVEAVNTGAAVDKLAHEAAQIEARPPDEPSITYRMCASIPSKGFIRVDVTRLVLTFGRTDDVEPVHLAIFLEPVTSTDAG